MIGKLKSLKNNQGFMKYFKNTSWLFGEKIFSNSQCPSFGMYIEARK